MKKNKGFTLIEIIITVALIGIVMSLTIPGVMNYFKDVDMDKARSEASDVLAVAQSYQDKLSLAGNYNGAGNIEITDGNVKKSIVEKANGEGVLVILKFKDGKISNYEYQLFDYSIQLSPSGNLIVLDVEDEFYNPE